MNFLRRPGPSSLPKGLFPTPKVQTVVANAWHATSSAAKDVFECLKCLQDLSTFETVILQESHLLHWWLLLAMQPKQCREDGHRSCRWNGSQETIGYLNTKSFFMFLYSFFSFFYFVCPYLVVCLFLSTTKKNSMSLHDHQLAVPVTSCNKFVTFNGPPRKDRTNLGYGRRKSCRGSKCFPIFSVEVFEFFDPFRENRHEKSTVTWRNFQKSIWNLNIKSQLGCFCWEKICVSRTA